MNLMHEISDEDYCIFCDVYLILCIIVVCQIVRKYNNHTIITM